MRGLFASVLHPLRQDVHRHFESSCPPVSKSLFLTKGSTGLTIFFLMIRGKAKVANQMLVCVLVFCVAPRTESEWSPIHEASMRSAQVGRGRPEWQIKLFSRWYCCVDGRYKPDRDNTNEKRVLLSVPNQNLGARGNTSEPDGGKKTI
ncbi:hypothetical protein NDU88_004485 [Pleurodeles waltl]|uniref:Uncharacterized protein n=1 Tax=Pleurodeles waltl TaxID=8319 RepID=A0AAV7L228_PLEWA|nr:hypothetical protein NDU88_004485 [Pleurodeles waltl]